MPDQSTELEALLPMCATTSLVAVCHEVMRHYIIDASLAGDPDTMAYNPETSPGQDTITAAVTT